MSVFAAGLPLFGAVVVAVGLVGAAVAVVVRIRGRDPFAGERGRLWIFHGEPDTGPHQARGTREHDRHVIDPATGTRNETRPQPAAGVAHSRATMPASGSTAAAARNAPTPAPTAPESDDLAAEWEQARPPMDS